MDLSGYFQMLARYNRIANERLYESCGALDAAEYRKPRAGSFGSIHGLLNHILLGDRIWMARFEGGGRDTPAVVIDDFPGLLAARTREDARIEAFFHGIYEAFFSRSFAYLNHSGKPYVDAAPVAVAHFFNHQTHHRGQVHVMLSQTGMAAPSLDLHRVIHP
ncbi:MAG: DinB family protein [Acidobacteriia bacterium]|nr:DinB family protein [Terriglobia bacterium]